MRCLAPLLLAALLAAPAAAASPLVPASVPGEIPRLAALAPVTNLVMRADPDGGRTLLLNVEDGVGGVYRYGPRALTPATVPDVREAGVFEHEYALADGTPMLALGSYFVTQSDGLVRVPHVLVENAQSASGVVAAAQQAVADAQQQSGFALLYAIELLVPELQIYFANAPTPAMVSSFKDYPTVYVWTVHRAGPAGEAWAGAYLARTGSIETDGAGRVTRAVKDTEIGVASRVDAETTRDAGAFLVETLAFDAGAPTAGEPQTQSATFVAGTVAAGARVPLAFARLDDARTGADLARYPDAQETGASVGVVADGAYVPLLGVRTTNAIRDTEAGHDVTRVTSVGPYVDGAYVPVAGLRYHSDTDEMVPVASRLVVEGPGGAAGNFEIDVGPFVDGEYVPVAGLVHRETFREARHSYQSLVGAGVYTPLGFVPLVVATYDGTRPLTTWALALVDGDANGDQWMTSLGTMAAGSYVPLVGVESVGAAPLGQRAQQQEVRVGVFAGSYAAFVPVAAVAWDAESTPAGHATSFVDNGTLGGPSGDFDVRVGTYATGSWTGLAEAQVRDANDGSDAAEAMIVLGAHGPDGFVPLVGVAYDGDAALARSLRSPLNLRDDARARLTVGTFVDGGFAPLLAVENGPESVRVIPLP